MTWRWTLTRKILCLALLNLLLLAGVVLAFARSQLRLGAESLLLGPARDHILAIASSVALDLAGTPVENREALLAGYNARYNAVFHLTDPDARPIAGPGPIPPEVRNRLPQVGPPPDRPPPPPPRKKGPPERKAGRKKFNLPPPPESVDATTFLVVSHNPTAYWAGARIPIVQPAGETEPGVLLVRSASMFNSKLFFDWRLWIGVALSIVAVTALCWLPFLRSLTRSITEMDRATGRIAEGRFDNPVATRRRDEVGHLGEQINRMAARLQGFVKNQRRFVGDIAHELCAPIARIQFALGILEQRAAESERPHVQVLYEEIQEMSGLVNELLSFSRAGLSATAAQLVPVNIAAIAERAVARDAQPGAPITVSIDRSLTAMANEPLLLRALSNLVRNAIRYAGESGPIEIAAAQQAGEIIVTVSDSGPGLPESQLEEVFAPFYRPEESRTRESGGVGLGLAIVRTCIETCGGTVTCRNRKPAGLEVVIRLRTAPTSSTA